MTEQLLCLAAAAPDAGAGMTWQFLAQLGGALALGLAALGSAIGIGVAGQAASGAEPARRAGLTVSIRAGLQARPA